MKTELPRGGGHAIRPRRRMFREGRPSSLWLHFGLHFGDIWGAKFATILLFGGPGGQNRPQKERRKKGQKKIKTYLTEITETHGVGVWAPLKHPSRQARTRN